MNYFYYFILLLLVVIILILSIKSFSSLIGLIRAGGVPYVPLSKEKLKFLQKKLKLNSQTKLVDLGCGDGRVLRLFENQGIKNLTGYEVNFWAFLLGKIKNKKNSKIKLLYKNFKKVNLSDYDTVFCYLLPEYLQKLKSKFEQELEPGTKLISYDFEIENWRKPIKVYCSENGQGRIFIYKI